MFGTGGKRVESSQGSLSEKRGGNSETEIEGEREGVSELGSGKEEADLDELFWGMRNESDKQESGFGEGGQELTDWD